MLVIRIILFTKVTFNRKEILVVLYRIKNRLRYEEKISPAIDDTVNAQLEEIESSIIEFSEYSKEFSATVHSYAKELSTIINSDPDLLAAFNSLPSHNPEIEKGMSADRKSTDEEVAVEDGNGESNRFVKFLEKHFPIVVFWRNPWNTAEKKLTKIFGQKEKRENDF